MQRSFSQGLPLVSFPDRVMFHCSFTGLRSFAAAVTALGRATEWSDALALLREMEAAKLRGREAAIEAYRGTLRGAQSLQSSRAGHARNAELAIQLIRSSRIGALLNSIKCLQ